MDMHGASHVVGILLGCAIGWVFGYVAGRNSMAAWLRVLGAHPGLKITRQEGDL